MKELTPEQIQHNWSNLRQLIDVNFSGERLEKLNTMYDYFEERMMFAPASGKEHFHNAHVGGYVEHVLHVVDSALKITNLWQASGATINFTTEEVIFAAMHHDLGKVGYLDNDHYIPNDSDWHIKNQGKYYVNNPDLQFLFAEKSKKDGDLRDIGVEVFFDKNMKKNYRYPVGLGAKIYNKIQKEKGADGEVLTGPENQEYLTISEEQLYKGVVYKDNETRNIIRDGHVTEVTNAAAQVVKGTKSLAVKNYGDIEVLTKERIKKTLNFFLVNKQISIY